MLEIKENVDIKDYCTFKVGGKCRYFIAVNNVDQIKQAYLFSKEKNLPIRFIGSGSNMIFPDEILENLLVKIEISGFDIINNTDKYVDIKVGAGEVWDSVVSRCVDMNLCGIEALSAIPGMTGSTPVQNVGAYGQEVKDTILEIDVLDLEKDTIKTILNKDCKFSYRDSIFKNDPPAGGKGKYVIVSIVFRLSKDKPSKPNYPGVQKYLDDNLITNPTLLDIRNAIIEIRKTKLPDTKEFPNVGSFFKNPIVNNKIVDELKKIYNNIPLFTINENYTKIPAGFLIENVGLKGCDFGSISTYINNALVLVNNGKATRADVDNVKDQIIKKVFDKFGIILETEPEFV
jgi:UDP-N-acetylmuramate dehydrogenase